MPCERGEHGRPDRERHSSRDLIDALTPLRVRWRVIVPHDPRLNRTAIKSTRPHHAAKVLILKRFCPDVLEPRISRMNTNSALPRGFVAAVYDCRIGAPPGAHRDAATAIARQGRHCIQQGRCFSPRGALRAGSASETWDAKGLASLPWNYDNAASRLKLGACKMMPCARQS